MSSISEPWSRRKFLGRLTAAGAVGLTGLAPGTAVAEPLPETTSIKIVYDPTVPILCYGPQYVATELLRAEGFTDISYHPFVDASTTVQVADELRAAVVRRYTADVRRLRAPAQGVALVFH